jgi:hypothetical protein
MRPSSHQPVATWLMTAAVGLALACGQAGSSAPAVGPSPLLQMDEDRLWILIWARGDMNPGCGKFYAQPDDPRYSDQRLGCERWERSAFEVLQANGGEGLELAHLRHSAFWDWYYEKAQAIARCTAASLRTPDSATAAGLERRLSCDPYRRLTQLERRTPREAGIRLP